MKQMGNDKPASKKEELMKRLVCFVLILAMLLALAACGRKVDNNEEPLALIDARADGSIVSNYNKTDIGTGGGSGFTIEEGEYLVIETALTEGKVHVRVTHDDSDIDKVPVADTDTAAVIDYVFEGSGTTEYMEIEPGNYMFDVTVEEKATGTITASKKSFSDDSASAGETVSAQ